MSERVLLLQGPLSYQGTNPVAQHLPLDDKGERQTLAPYHAAPLVQAMAVVFRRAGWRVVYSGWTDDADWFRTHLDLFDQVVLSDQGRLSSLAIVHGKIMPNNKEKLYAAAALGLKKVRELYGDGARVLRLRSDVAVDLRLAEADMARLLPGEALILVEYLNTRKPLWMNDFMQMGQAGALAAVYTELSLRSLEDESFHLSSHVDHFFALLKAYQDGKATRIGCLSRALFDSVVWRGVPRYLEYSFPEFQEGLEFGQELEMAALPSWQELLAAQDAGARGTRVPPELSLRSAQ